MRFQSENAARCSRGLSLGRPAQKPEEGPGIEAEKNVLKFSRLCSDGDYFTCYLETV